MKRLSTYLLAGVAVFSASCADFLDTAPKDALSPATTWKTETDAESFVVGCYNGLLNPSSILYLDCGSDIGYNNFPWEGWRAWGDGSLASGNTGNSFYDFAIIHTITLLSFVSRPFTLIHRVCALFTTLFLKFH